MKKILFTSMAIAMLISCEKKELAKTVPPKASSSNSQQDTALIGTWILDSVKYDGNITQPFPQDPVNKYGDTIFISSSNYTDHIWSTMLVSVSCQWETTVNDSLFAGSHSKYSVTYSGNKILWQYLNNKPNPNQQRWWHKK